MAGAVQQKQCIHASAYRITVAPDTYQGKLMRTKTLILWLLLSVTIPSFAYDAFQSGDLYYDVTSDNTVAVALGDYSELTSVIIPETVTYGDKTYRVTAIETGAFENCTSLTSVTIPNSVTKIGRNAFYGCTGLSSVTIPKSVTTIGTNAFYDVFNIVYSGTADGAPWGAENMNGGYAEGYLLYSDATKTSLLKCRSIATGEIIIPNCVTSIGGYAFGRCTGLTSVTIPDGVTNIGDWAFYGCTGLTSVTIPNSVTSIGNDAFHDVFNIVYSGTADGAPWGAENMNGYVEGYLLYSDSTKTSLLKCRSIATGEIIIPNSVTKIGDYAFSGCIGLRYVTIPNSVTHIGNHAFSDCIYLYSVTIPNSVTSIGDYAFSGCTYIIFVAIPNNSVTIIGDYAFSGCTHLRVVTIPNSVTHIGDGAFYGCTELASVTIPHSVTTIGAGAFDGVHNIVYFGTANGAPWGADNMNKGYVDGNLLYADAGKTTLLHCKSTVTGEIIIPNSVTSIEREAFYGCTGLTSVTIPSSVTSIGNYAFYGCTGLTSVVWNAKNCQGWSQSDDSPFYTEKNKSSITSFAFGNDVKSIPSYLCYGMNKLTSIAIPNSVTSIGSSAFDGCIGLASVTIPNNVTSMGDSAFYNCTGLTSVVWNAKNCQGWSQSDDSPFYVEKNKSSITSFAFGNDVKSIPSYLCYGMNKLTSITIPNNVTSIGSNAFSDCSRITSITIPSSVREVGNSIVSGCRRLDTVVWNARDCQGWNQYNDSPFYDEKGESIISYFAFGNGVENIPSYLCYGMNVLSSVTIPNSVQTIGQNAFENCKYLEEVSFGMGIEDIGENAFAGDGRIYSITCYADITPTIYESTFSGVSSNAELHVLANLVKKYKVNEYWGRFTIVPIGVDNTTDGTLSVTPSETDATFTWPTNDNADTYTLTIQKGNVVFCTLIFNGEGQLTTIAFAPARNGEKRTPHATLTTDGYKFTVTGLDEDSHYTYQIAVKDLEDNVLNTYQGEFRTKGGTSVENVLTQSSPAGVQKVMRNGQVYILRNGKTYTMQGVEIE